jgi:3-deoxy-D-manno-octulosonate 8-phosphate phosphatase (KDO 8-P phosphatase)
LKRFDVRDGLAVRMLQRAGIVVALLSGGRSGAIEQRACHLGISDCLTGVGDKQVGLELLRHKLGIAREATAFLGDDLNDLTVRPVTGLLVSPANGSPALRRQADWVLGSRGGDGALRELSEALLDSQGQLASLHRHGWRESND